MGREWITGVKRLIDEAIGAQPLVGAVRRFAVKAQRHLPPLRDNANKLYHILLKLVIMRSGTRLRVER